MKEYSFKNLVKDNELIKDINLIINSLDKELFVSESEAYTNPNSVREMETMIKKVIEDSISLKNLNYKFRDDYHSYIDEKNYNIHYTIINNSDSEEPEACSTRKLDFTIVKKGLKCYLFVNDIEYNKKLVEQDISINYALRDNIYHANFTCGKSKMIVNFQYCENMFFSNLRYAEDEYSEISHKLDYNNSNIQNNEFYNPYFEKIINLSNLTEGNGKELGEDLILLLKDLMFEGKKIETDIIESYQLLKDIDLSEFSFLSVDKSINQTLTKKNRLK